jgi:hypothetical protein
MSARPIPSWQASPSMCTTAALVVCSILSAAPARGHDWYTGLKSPEGKSCCNGHDCARVPLCIGASGHEGLELKGVCFPIPWDKVLDVPSPDGDAHVCWENRPDLFSPVRPLIRCVILPGVA